MTNVNGLIVGNVYRWLSTKAPQANCLAAAFKQKNEPLGIVLTHMDGVSSTPSCAEANKCWLKGVTPDDIFRGRQVYLPGFNPNVSGLSKPIAEALGRAVQKGSFVDYLPPFVVEEVYELPGTCGKSSMIRARSTTTAETFYLVPSAPSGSDFFEETK